MKKFFIIFFLLVIASFPQSQIDNLKAEAQRNMQLNKLGEAIDLLNKYIAAKPQSPDGYNLRGLCYERRGQYEYALYDYRSARKLAPNDGNINRNLNRVTKSFDNLLLNKIEGHKREIALNSQKPVNYLEIGKSYKNMGNWKTAEEWYDKYLTKEHASPDEIIRYTEILAKNNHIAKGEPILKRYTSEYPSDQRLWSRYGYFLLWLGKNKLAINAFEHALELKPYFKEAMDGLDRAKGKGYIYTFNDTSYTKRANYFSRGGTKNKVKKYAGFPIDNYYKQLEKKSDDNETRFKLVDELIKYDRYEEAYEQLEILSADYSEDQRYISYFDKVKAVRDSIGAVQVSLFQEKLKSNPNDKEAVLRLAEFYGTQAEYDSSISIIQTYLKDKDENNELDVRFRLAKYMSWNYQFEDAIDQLNILFKNDPENIDYKLLRSQIAVWTSQDLDMAEQYLNDVLAKDKDNVEALVSLASLKVRQGDLEAAKEKLDLAKSLAPNNKEIESVMNYYEAAVSNQEDLKNYKILESARALVLQGNCSEAINLYKEYFSKINAPTRLESSEYADVLSCAKDYSQSLSIYDSLLAQQYDFDLAVSRGKILIWMGDSLAALNEFQRLVKENPDDYEANLNLGVSYEYMRENEKAIEIYQNLLKTTDDSVKIQMLNTKIGYLSATYGGGDTFFGSIAIAPLAGFYRDNQDFYFNDGGTRFEIGLANFLSVGATLLRYNLKNDVLTNHLTTFKGNLSLRFSKLASASVGFGVLSYDQKNRRNISDAAFTVEKKDTFAIKANFENTDARILLYSPNLLGLKYDASLYRLTGYYNSKTGLRLSGYTSFIDVSDKNNGGDLQLRIGKNFHDEFSIGYEYFYTNYSKVSKYYYSPQNFESHSVWGEWNAFKDEDIKLTINGKLGYIPTGDYIIREITAECEYHPIQSLIISGKLNIGSTYRFESSYNYISCLFSAYWGFY